MLSKIKKTTYLTGVILAGTLVFFFSFKHQAGVGESGELTIYDMQTIQLSAHQDFDLLPIQLDWVESEHAGSVGPIYRYISRFKTGLNKRQRHKVARLIVSQSRRYHFNPYFITALMQVESTFRNGAVSKVGARGLMQIRPFVAKALAEELGLKWKGQETLFNPYFNVRTGTYYLYKLRKRFKDHVQAMISAYNYGPTRIAIRARHKRDLPQNYYRKVSIALGKIQASVERLALKDRGATSWTI